MPHKLWWVLLQSLTDIARLDPRLTVRKAAIEATFALLGDEVGVAEGALDGGRCSHCVLYMSAAAAMVCVGRGGYGRPTALSLAKWRHGCAARQLGAASQEQRRLIGASAFPPGPTYLRAVRSRLHRS